MRSGQAKALTLISQPAWTGLIAEARLRGTAVRLAAAARSEGVTTAITYELRVGTSICDSALRMRRRTMTQDKLGRKGMRIRSTFAGRCVNTMVFTSPMRLEIRTATRYENADRTPVQKKIVPATAVDSSNLSKSHKARRDCTMKPPPNASMLKS